LKENHPDETFRMNRGGGENLMRDFETILYLKSLFFYLFYCHFFRIPLLQRDMRVTEEVTVAVLLSPQPARGRLTSRENR
jgi:hypothetical protein